MIAGHSVEFYPVHAPVHAESRLVKIIEEIYDEHVVFTPLRGGANGMHKSSTIVPPPTQPGFDHAPMRVRPSIQLGEGWSNGGVTYCVGVPQRGATPASAFIDVGGVLHIPLPLHHLVTGVEIACAPWEGKHAGADPGVPVHEG